MTPRKPVKCRVKNDPSTYQHHSSLVTRKPSYRNPVPTETTFEDVVRELLKRLPWDMDDQCIYCYSGRGSRHRKDCTYRVVRRWLRGEDTP